MINLIKSTFYKEEQTKKKLVKFISLAEKLSFGKVCEDFERQFANYQGRKYCVFVNSGSSANLALIQAVINLGLVKKEDSIGFSSLTWSTNVMPIIQLGLNPIAVDVEMDTLNVSSRKLIEALSKNKIKTLFLTNLLGLCDDIDKIVEICRRKNILLFEDNCEALGTVYKKTKLGNFGFASTFSFYVGHHMSTIEGGAICTDNKELADMLRLVRAHGWDRNLSAETQDEIRIKHRVNSNFYSRYTFYDLGYNLRPTEINGFLGLEQLKFLPEILKKRNENFMTLVPLINAVKDKYYPIKYDHIDFVSSFAIPVICRSQKIRDKLVEKCNGKLEIRPIVGGDMTRQPFFKKITKKNNGKTNSSRIHNQGFYFGNNPELTQKEITEIKKLLLE